MMGLTLSKKLFYKSTEILKINGTLALEIGREQKIKSFRYITKKQFLK